MRSISHLLAVLTVLSLLTAASWGQRPVTRITQAVRSSERVVLQDSVHPRPASATDEGALDGATPIHGITIVFRPSAQQQAALQTLLNEQQDPHSSNYHHWLTPEQFAARFGMSQTDLDTVTNWLKGQGFTVTRVARSRNGITFSGTAAQVTAAFQTQLHRYRVAGKAHFANVTPLSIPAAFANVVLGVRNLNDFRPLPRQRAQRILTASPRFTSTLSGNHFLAPDDFATIYGIQGLYNAGDDGAGQKIAVVGQTAISLADIEAFRSAAGLRANNPELILVPGTGGSAFSDYDEGEADLDVEWAGGIARNATVLYVYAGNDQNTSVFDALGYAIDQDLAPIISISYGLCEADFGRSNSMIVQQWAQQANAQGQTIVAAAGDTGAADCDGGSLNPSYVVTSASRGFSVDVPAAIPEVTGIGGSEFNGDVSSASQYWRLTNNGSNGSAQSYIPEDAWNDSDSSNGILAGGGGKSIYFAKPAWQTAPGVPQDGQRDVPDISFNASPAHDGYLVCSAGSCTVGFRDNNSNLTVFGGTSAGAPAFAGMLALIEQAKQSNGEGNINQGFLYSLAATPSTYASVFHDVTSGNNNVPCTSGTTDCPSGTTSFGFTAGPGYDQATGLGSVDAFNLTQAILNGPPPAPRIATSTTVTNPGGNPNPGDSVTYLAAITPTGGSTAALTGTVQFTDNGVPLNQPVTVVNGQASTSTTYSTGGSHIIQAIYSGDRTYAGSTGALGPVTVSGTVPTFSISANPTTVTMASVGSKAATITATSSNGLQGSIYFTCSVASTGSTAPKNIPTCSIPGSVVLSSAASSGSTTLTLTTATSSAAPPVSSKGSFDPPPIWMLLDLGGLTVLLLFGVSGRKRRFTPVMAVLIMGLALGLAGCGGGGGGSNSGGSDNNGGTSPTGSGGVPAGTYQVTVLGTGPNNSGPQMATLTVMVQ